MTVTRLLLAIVALSMAIAFVHLAIMALIIAGLIFRTKETLVLLFVGSALTLIAAHPIVASSAIAATIVAVVLVKGHEQRQLKMIEDPDQE